MKKSMTSRQVALINGISIVLMTLIAGIIMAGIFAPLFEMNQIEFEKYMNNKQSLYLFGIIGWILILITDVIVSWGLFRYYAGKNLRKARITGLLRLTYSAILLVGIIQLFLSYSAVSRLEMEKAHTLLCNFQAIWQFGLIIFGVHLLYLSRLVCEKGTIRQFLAVLLFLAGIGYVGSNTADLFIVNYEDIRAQVEVYFILPMVLGEFGLAIWLLIKGGREERSAKIQCAS